MRSARWMRGRPSAETTTGPRVGAWVIVGALLPLACAQTGDEADGSGGVFGSGGGSPIGGSGAATATGGSSPGAGGVPGAGGADGAGGSSSGGSSSGGSSSGGSSSGGNSSGGSSSGGSSSGGSSSGGSSSGGSSSGGSTGATMGWSFDDDLEGWLVSWEVIGGESNSPPVSSMAKYDGSRGDPSPGSLELSGPFSDKSDQTFVSHFPVSPLDMSGETLTARVELESGLSTSAECPGGAYLFAKSGDFNNFVRGPYINLEVGETTNLELDFESPAYSEGSFMASDVVEIGVAINASSSCTSNDVWAPFVVNIDSVLY